MHQHHRLRRALLVAAPLLIILGLAVLPTAAAVAGDLVFNAGVDAAGDTHAVLVADIGDTGRATAYFQYRPEGTDQWQHTDNIVVQSGDHLRVPVNDLQRDTTYEFRAVVETRDGRYGWTDTQTFTTGSESGESGEESGIVAAINDLKQTIKEQFGGESLGDAIVRAFFGPFLALAQALLEFLVDLLTTTPDVYPNEAVEDVHRRALQVTMLLASPAFMLAGLLYMTGPLFGIEYAQVRKVLPRLLVALAFATVSLPLLQLAVELTQALTTAFGPSGRFISLPEVVGLSSGLVLVWFVQSILLLVVTVAFVIRAVYIMFVAAISPLIALAWAIPRAKRYADSFIAGWFTALAMAPLDVLVLRFVLEVYQGANGVTLPVDNWVYGTAGLVLLVLVPYQLYGASQSALGMGYAVGRGIKKQYREYRSSQRQERSSSTARSTAPSEGRPRQNRYPKDRILNDVDRNNDD